MKNNIFDTHQLLFGLVNIDHIYYFITYSGDLYFYQDIIFTISGISYICILSV